MKTAIITTFVLAVSTSAYADLNFEYANDDRFKHLGDVTDMQRGATMNTPPAVGSNDRSSSIDGMVNAIDPNFEYANDRRLKLLGDVVEVSTMSAPTAVGSSERSGGLDHIFSGSAIDE